jgi:hypothetical protein
MIVPAEVGSNVAAAAARLPKLSIQPTAAEVGRWFLERQPVGTAFGHDSDSDRDVLAAHEGHEGGG